MAQNSIPQALFETQLGRRHAKSFFDWNETTARKLELDTTLRGHNGCVNRLAWNTTEGGTLLASCSDDTDIRLWRYPPTPEGPRSWVVKTQHEANIFGVQFLPHSGSEIVVTGAMDGTVQMHHLAAAPIATRHANDDHDDVATGVFDVEGRDASYDDIIPVESTVFNCHNGRVKHVDVHPSEPDLFWSGAEDGTVRQFDVRMNPSLMAEHTSPNVLLTALSRKYRGRRLEIKSFALNPCRPYQLAVAASEPAVRMYDRRMLGCTNSTTSYGDAREEKGLVLRLTPPHLALAPTGGGGAAASRERGRRCWWDAVYGTHVTFGNRGDKLLTTFHKADCYSFDVTSGGGSGGPSRAVRMGARGQQQPEGGGQRRGGAAAQRRYDFFKPPLGTAVDAARRGKGRRSELGPGVLPLPADAACVAGNVALGEGRFPSAVWDYSVALRVSPDSSLLLLHRALALLRRNWVGDAADALADAESATAADPESHVACLRRAQALQKCGMVRSARAAAAICRQRFEMLDGEAIHDSHMNSSGSGAIASSASVDEATPQSALRELEIKIESDLIESEKYATARRQHAAARQQGLRRRGMSSDPRLDRRNPGPENNASGDSNDETESDVNHEGGGEAGDDDSDVDSYERGNTQYTSIDNLDRAFEQALLELSAEMLAQKDGGGVAKHATACSRQEASALPRRRTPMQPWLWGALPGSHRLLHRYAGHLNEHTDIKEAIFLGDDDGLVASGSDDGRVYLYDAGTGARIVKILEADEDVANCIRSHPTLPVLATSGIENVVKLWTPKGAVDPGADIERAAEACQASLRGESSGLPPGFAGSPLLEALLRSPELMRAYVRRATGVETGEPDGAEVDGDDGVEIECRQS